MGLFNTTCPLSNDYIEAPNIELPIVGKLKLQWLLFWMAAAFAIISTTAGLFLAFRHLRCYVRPREQRQIIRIAFYPVVFAVLNCFEIYDYGVSIYLDPISGIYEPIALTALFLLFVEFSEPNIDNREHYFRNLQNYKVTGGFNPKKRKFEPIPGGCLRWFQGKFVALFCYLVAFMSIKAIEIITQAAGRFCSSSYSFAFAHIWVIIISYIALPVGVDAVIRFYTRMVREEHVKAHNPTMKILSFKAVLLLSFFQEILFTILISTNTFKGTKTVTMRDFKIGIQSLLVCFEQAICSVWFHWSFSTREYKQHEKMTGEKRMGFFYAFLHAFYPEDLFHGTAYAFRLIMKGVGPWGNGSWNKRGGGYKEVQDAADEIRLNRSKTYRGRERAISNVSHASSAEDESEMTTLQHTTPGEMESGLTPQFARIPRAHNAEASSHRSRSRSPYGDELGRVPSPYDPTRPYDSAYGAGAYGVPYEEADQGAPPQYLDSRELLPRSRDPSPDPKPYSPDRKLYSEDPQPAAASNYQPYSSSPQPSSSSYKPYSPDPRS